MTTSLEKGIIEAVNTPPKKKKKKSFLFLNPDNTQKVRKRKGEVHRESGFNRKELLCLGWAAPGEKSVHQDSACVLCEKVENRIQRQRELANAVDPAWLTLQDPTSSTRQLFA